MDVIFNRRSIRRYKKQAVEPDKVEKLLRSAMQAPSAVNQQPWEFIVVQNKGGLERLADKCIFKDGSRSSIGHCAFG